MTLNDHLLSQPTHSSNLLPLVLNLPYTNLCKIDYIIKLSYVLYWYLLLMLVIACTRKLLLVTN